MAANEIHVGGLTTFRATVREDGTAISIATATLLQLLFEKPDGTKLTRTGALSTDGTDGKYEYTCVPTDLDTGGNWRVQGDIALAGGWAGKSEIVSFKVHDNIT